MIGFILETNQIHNISSPHYPSLDPYYIHVDLELSPLGMIQDHLNDSAINPNKLHWYLSYIIENSTIIN